MTYSFRLLKRKANRSEAGPFEDLEFTWSCSGPTVKSGIARARMESDDLHSLETDSELDLALQTFLDHNFDLLHYYMD